MFVFVCAHLWPFAEVSLTQRDLSFVPSCKTETWDLGGGCMDCQVPSLDLCSSPTKRTGPSWYYSQSKITHRSTSILSESMIVLSL